MADTKQQRIRSVHNLFKKKMENILDRKKTLLCTYRKKIEEVKIQEIKKSLNI